MQRFFDKKINKHYLYLDDNNTPILLPCLFARYTQKLLLSISRVVEQDSKTGKSKQLLVEKEIGKHTAYQICNRLGLFIEYIEEYKKNVFVSVHTHTALPNDIINEYLNEYLVVDCGKSKDAVKKHINAINSYYNWLSRYFDNKPKSIGLKSRYRQAAINNSTVPLSVKYLLPATRELFYASAKSLLQEIVLRNGGELGCRASENQGFLLEDFTSGKQRNLGFLSLFNLLDTKPEQEEFTYYLSSIWTKYGRSRTLYIPRYLLRLMRQYYKEERPKSTSPHLFVSNSNQNRGQRISTAYASDVFFQVKEKLQEKITANPERFDDIQEIHSSFSYHVLRHSFGTDLFYDLSQGQNKSVESITTTSAVFIETARRMGHKVDSAGASDVTKRYIHGCVYRDTLIRGIVDGK